MANITNVNQMRLAMATATGVAQALSASRVVQSGAGVFHEVDYLGDTNNVVTFGAVTEGALKNRRDDAFTVHTISDAQGTISAYALQGVITLSDKRLRQANGPIADALAKGTKGNLTEALIAEQIGQAVRKQMALLVVHTLVARAIASSMSYDISGETSPADIISADTYLGLLSGMKLEYDPEEAPPAACFISSLQVGAAFNNIRNTLDNKPIFGGADGDTISINGVPFIGYKRVDADAGVLTGAYGTISTDSPAKHRLLRVQRGAVHLFTTATPESMASRINVMRVGDAETGNKGPGIQASYELEIAAYSPALMDGEATCGVTMGLVHV